MWGTSRSNGDLSHRQQVGKQDHKIDYRVGLQNWWLLMRWMWIAVTEINRQILNTFSKVNKVSSSTTSLRGNSADNSNTTTEYCINCQVSGWKASPSLAYNKYLLHLHHGWSAHYDGLFTNWQTTQLRLVLLHWPSQMDRQSSKWRNSWVPSALSLPINLRM